MDIDSEVLGLASILQKFPEELNTLFQQGFLKIQDNTLAIDKDLVYSRARNINNINNNNNNNINNTSILKKIEKKKTKKEKEKVIHRLFEFDLMQSVGYRFLTISVTPFLKELFEKLHKLDSSDFAIDRITSQGVMSENGLYIAYYSLTGKLKGDKRSSFKKMGSLSKIELSNLLYRVIDYWVDVKLKQTPQTYIYKLSNFITKHETEYTEEYYNGQAKQNFAKENGSIEKSTFRKLHNAYTGESKANGDPILKQ